MNIYVGNLASTVTEEKLRDLFEQYGEVTVIKIIKDKFTGIAKGFAFVEMPSNEAAQEAMNKLNGQNIEGKNIKVNEARPPEARPSRPGGNRFGGPSHGGGDRRGPRSNNGGGGGWGR